MPRLIKTPAQKRWVTIMFERGAQSFVNDSYSFTGQAERSFRYITGLVKCGVLRPWRWQPYEDSDVYEPRSDDGVAPLMLAGPAWDAFVHEAHELGLLQEQP